MKTRKNRLKINKTKFIFGKQLKLQAFRYRLSLIVKTSKIECNKVIPLLLNKNRLFFDFNSIPPCLQQWLPIITEASKIQCRMVIPWVINENRLLFLNLSQHGLQIASDI